jgi:hypothetical protein
MSSGSKHHSGFFIATGLFFCAWWLLGFMAQIQTNEAALGWGGVVNGFNPVWEILWQPLRLILGQLGSIESIATFISYAVEGIFFACVVLGIEKVMHATSRNGMLAGKLFLVAALGILIWNSRNDYLFGSFPIGSGDTPHWVFMGSEIIVVGFFLTIGVYFVEVGWHKA